MVCVVDLMARRSFRDWWSDAYVMVCAYLIVAAGAAFSLAPVFV